MTTNPLGGGDDTTGGGGDDGGGGGGGDDGGGGGGGGNGLASGWSYVALNDTSSLDRGENDMVSAIVMTSASSGYAVTEGSQQTAGEGGAIFKIADKSASVVFDGMTGGISVGGTDFTTIVATPAGFAATGHAAEVVLGDASGHFAIQTDGNLEGGEPLLGMRVTAAGTTLVRHTGVVSTTTDAPGPAAEYTDVWAPNATEPVPAGGPPPDQCQGGPLGTGQPVTDASVYLANNFIAYTSSPNFDPQICISKDGGKSFYPTILGITDNDAAQSPPTGITFANATVGMTFWGSMAEIPYVMTTGDGGKSFQPAALPSGVAQHGLELNGGAFAPDAQHAWIVGYDHTDQKAIVFASTDAGKTWTKVTTGLGDVKLYSVFALDATHVWIGGDRGVLIVSE